MNIQLQIQQMQWLFHSRTSYTLHYLPQQYMSLPVRERIVSMKVPEQPSPQKNLQSQDSFTTVLGVKTHLQYLKILYIIHLSFLTIILPFLPFYYFIPVGSAKCMWVELVWQEWDETQKLNKRNDFLRSFAYKDRVTPTK